MKTTGSKDKIISIIACMVIQLCIGIVYMWSALKSDVATAYGWSQEAAGMVYSYMLMSYVIGNFSGGFINDRKGPKVTCFIGVLLFAMGLCGAAFSRTPLLFDLTYGVIAGFGSGVAYGACISCIQKWMPDRMGLATGLACCSFGLSTVIFTPVITSLMNLNRDSSGIVNFRPVFLTVAAVMALFGLLGVFIMKVPRPAAKEAGAVTQAVSYVTSANEVSGTANAPAVNYTFGQAVKTPAFWALFFSILLINGTWNLCVPLIKDLGIVRGLSEGAAIACVSVTGIANAAGRLSMAALSDKLGRYPVMYFLCLLNVVGAVLMTFIPGAGYFAAVVMLAFAFGGPSSLNAAMSTDLFGPKYSGTNYGAAMMAVGISSILFNFISNKFIHSSVDAASGTSTGIAATFIMAAICAVIPFFLMLYLSHYLKKRK